MNDSKGHTPAAETASPSGRNTLLKRCVKILAWIAGIWLGLLLIMQIVLSPSILNSIIDRYASDFIDGDLEFKRVKVEMFRHFPNAGISIEEGALTYPAERYDSLENAGPQGILLYGGCGEEADTLASFRHFSAGINIASLLTGKISIPYVRLDKPRIFAHSYDSLNANWNIFRTSSSDTTETVLPPISVGRIRLTGHPHIVYTDSRDTLFAMIDVSSMSFDGRLDTRRASRNRISLEFDSMLVAGRIAADTIGLNMERLHMHEHNDHMDIHASAKALLATRAFGRIHIPISIKGTAGFPDRNADAIALHGFKAEIAALPIDFDLDLRRKDGHMNIDGRFAVEGCKIEDLTDGFLRNIIPATADIRTDAVISLSGTCSGTLGNGTLPAFDVSMDIPQSRIKHKSLEHEVILALSAEAGTDDEGRVNASIGKLKVSTYGMDIDAMIDASDVLSEDPLIGIDGKIRASADSLATFLPKDSGITAEGGVDAKLKGSIKLSQMDIYNFGQAEISGDMTSERFTFRSPGDTISVALQGIAVSIGPESKTSVRNPEQTFRLLGINGNISNAEVALKDVMTFSGSSMSFSAKNSTEALSGKEKERIHPLGGHLKAAELALKDGDGMSITLDNTENSFQMVPKDGHPDIPVLSLNSSNKRIYLRDNTNRIILTDADLNGTAAMNSIERRQKRRAFMDSLALANPNIPRDSLMAQMRARRNADFTVPEWMEEEDFKAGDINFSLDGILAEYFRKWDISGRVRVRTGILMTPYLPLRNILKGLDMSFDNNAVRINGFKLNSGKSEIAAKGSLGGLRRALLGRGTYRLDLDLSTEKMDADELLAALSTGASFTPPSDKEEMAEASDSEFLQMVTADSLIKEDVSPLIIVPADLNADIGINAAGVRFSDLFIDSLTADIVMKERCMQIVNSKASTNMGKAEFEGFYATRSKKDIKTGFNFNLTDVTSEKVIAMMPAIDTIMPLLKSFSGLIDCELAATARLDTMMNVLTPTINGVIRIGGENLRMSENKVFSDLARKLKFKNSKEGRIDRMTVEGVIKDNILEVFPFVLELDRYTLALSGLHNLDMSYRYHASIIRSPIVFKVGVDIYGPDFDNMKFKIGKPKYRSTDVPVFTAVIDETRINLAESIRGIFEKGVDIAVRENEKQAAINEHKARIGYINAAEQQIEELTAEEQRQLEEERVKADTVLSVDSLSISNTLNEMIINKNR